MTESKRGRPRKTDDETETKNESKPKTIAMTRELQPGESGPTTADVHRDEVDNWKADGWREA